MKKSTVRAKHKSTRKTKKQKPEVKTKPEVELEGLATPEQPLMFYGPPPAIKQLYKKSGFDKNFHPFDMLAHMCEGHSRSEIVASWGITYSKFNEWLEAYPELAEAYSVGKPAFDAYHKRALRYSAFGQLTKVREASLFFMLKNQAGMHEDGNGSEFSDGAGAELEFVDENE